MEDFSLPKYETYWYKTVKEINFHKIYDYKEQLNIALLEGDIPVEESPLGFSVKPLFNDEEKQCAMYLSE